MTKQSPNPALNLAPFGRWTLRDKAAQRRLALRYLRHVLGRIADHPINRVEELLPWNVAASLPDVLRLAA